MLDRFWRSALRSTALITLGSIFPAGLQALEVEVYSQAHLSADSVDDGADRSEYLASNSSRLGLRLNQDVGGGLNILLQYEQGMDLTGQGGNDGNGGAEGDDGSLFTQARDSFIGLGGSFGTLRVGKLSGLNQWVYDFNLFADQVGDLGNIWGGNGLPGRISDAVQYISPEYRGLTLGITHVPEEGEDDSDLSLLKVDFGRDTLKLGAAYITLREDWESYALTGSYDFGAFRIGGGWQRETSAGDIPGNDRDAYTLGVSFTIANNFTLKAQAAHSDADLAEANATQWSLGLDYRWNPSLTLYTALASVSNDANAGFAANNWGKGDAVFPLAGNDPHAVSVGLIYTFGHTLEWSQ